MHELLAPLLYVLHVDVEHLAEVKKAYADHFVDKFDGFSFHENDLTYKFDFKKFSGSVEDDYGFQDTSANASSLSELDAEVQTIVLLNDAYGAEGELGIVLSEKFMEHDAYSMFDSLMSGYGGAIAMAEFFSPSLSGKSHTGTPPVIEASAAIYHLLYNVDSSLHTHLVELEVEPQYFALRWLRVLFGREFSLEDLLVIWDEIFSHENTKSSITVASESESNFSLLESPRGAFICAFAVSMILNLRSSLLATENATICLQRLLNFPEDVKLVKLLAKAKSLHAVATDANKLSTTPVRAESYDRRKSAVIRGHSLSMDCSSSPKTPLTVVPDSYWEEKWRVLHKEEENKQGAAVEQIPTRKKGWSERVRLRLSRTESDPSPSKKNERTKTVKPSVRRSLLEDLAQQLGSDDDAKDNNTVFDIGESAEASREDATDKNYESSSSAHGSEENSSNFSDPSGPIHDNSDNENELERSSVASNSSIEENDTQMFVNNPESSPLPVSSNLDGASEIDENDTKISADNPESSPPSVSSYQGATSSKSPGNDESVRKLATGIKEIKHLSGKFQWLWKLGRNANEGTSERTPEDAKACNDGVAHNSSVSISTADGCNRSSGTSKGETVDQNLMVSLKNIGQSMIENIQVHDTNLHPA